MILKKGITGFFDVRDESKDETGYYDFKKICYSIRMNNLKLLEVCNSDNARYFNTSYFYAHFILDDNDLYILLNKYYPVVAFVQKLEIDKKFIDFKRINVYFTGYEIINANILNSEFTGKEHNLSPVELEQIKYWEPGSIGNIIYNEWD